MGAKLPARQPAPPAGQRLTAVRAIAGPPMFWQHYCVSASIFEHRPERCPHGYVPWPGRAQVSWTPCICQAAREWAERERGFRPETGHRGVSLGHARRSFALSRPGRAAASPACGDDNDRQHEGRYQLGHGGDGDRAFDPPGLRAGRAGGGAGRDLDGVGEHADAPHRRDHAAAGVRSPAFITAGSGVTVINGGVMALTASGLVVMACRAGSGTRPGSRSWRRPAGCRPSRTRPGTCWCPGRRARRTGRRSRPAPAAPG